MPNSGVVLTRIKEGARTASIWPVAADNFGKNVNKGTGWNTDILDLNFRNAHPGHEQKAAILYKPEHEYERHVFSQPGQPTAFISHR